MPSYLGDYRGAAKGRDSKLVRAVNSCLSQSFKDFELIIIADGCNRTFEIIKENYSDDRITCILIQKQELWSGAVRNTGIKNAKGEFILYLDTDDMFGNDHLKIIDDELKKIQSDWVYFDDYIVRGKSFDIRLCNIDNKSENGTSNICHKRSMNVYWANTGYAHDWHFIQDLKNTSKQYQRIQTPRYYVCHIPFQYDI